MLIYLGADHGGFKLKEIIKNWLIEKQYQVEDCGALVFDEQDDYPDFAFAVASKVKPALPDALGILFCRSGGGMAMAANKVKGIRAIEVFSQESAQHARTNNQANIITFSADWFNEAVIKSMIETFLTAEFTNEARHLRRLAKVTQYENASHVLPLSSHFN